MNYKDIKLTSEKTIRVHVPPSIKLSSMLEKMYPDPEMPFVEEEVAGGRTIRMVIEDDPDYLRELALAEEKREEELNKLTLLYTLKGEQVPEDWNMDELAEILRVSNPSWMPREGMIGKKLDYFEWDLLGSPRDIISVQEALAELIGVDMDEVDFVEKSFQSDVEGATTGEVADQDRPT